jgi:mevalonate kinase
MRRYLPRDLHVTAPQYIKVRAPAKLVISGEHAVVCGNPAIGIAVNRYMDVTIRWLKLAQWSFELMGISFKRQTTLRTLHKLKSKIHRQYERFKEGEHPIRDVLKHPFELSLYTATNVVEKFRRHLPSGIGVATDSNIPTGCGMGSSAACVVGLIHAMSELMDLQLNIDDYVALGIESENLQHGNSSGLDVNLVYRGGCQYYANQTCTPLNYPTDWNWQLVNTGTPASSTGECVTAAKKQLTQAMLTNFSTTTQAMRHCLQNQLLGQAQQTIADNHQLLRRIEVVPKRVAQFIHECEDQNLAAKVCGAGACYGDAAGMVLVLGDHSVSELCQSYGYELLPMQIETRGSHVL